MESGSPPASSPRRPGWRGGRPPGGVRRTAALPQVRVTPEEMAEVRRQAEEFGLAVGELIRRALFGRRSHEAVPAINREAWGRLGPLAANLNQYVKAIHQGRAAGAPLELLEQIRAQVLLLRESLLGRDPEN
jgi:hypothetical protein